MESSALQVSQFQDPYNFDSLVSDGKVNLPKEYSDIDSVWGKIGSRLGFVDRAGYDEYLKQRDRDYERASINSARSWEEYLDSTKYQRMVSDLKKAGLNPWLALQNGLSGSAQQSSTSTGGSSAKSSGRDDSKEISSLISAAAKIFAALILG